MPEPKGVTRHVSYDNAGEVVVRKGVLFDAHLDAHLGGGAGDDTLHGGDRNDRLAGRAGDDTLYGGKGDDCIFGGSWAGLSDDGDDTLYGGEGDDTLVGGNWAIRVQFRDGDDGGDTLYGEDGDDTLIGGNLGGDGGILGINDDGDDTLYGGTGDDTLIGGNFDNIGKGRLNGEDGNDTLYGGDGDDKLIGGHSGFDRHWQLWRINGDERILEQSGVWPWKGDVGDGNDTLEGGKGNDDLWGGGGADRFVFDRESDTDTIHDFEDGKDTLVIKGGLKFADLDIKQSGDDTVINGPSDAFSIVLEGIQASLLTADDFNFIA